VSNPVQIAPCVHLFALDDAGLFFSESRQELHLFNAAATFLWFSLEEGVPPSALAGLYAEAFGVDSREAERSVAALLEQWRGLGYLTGLEVGRAPPIDFPTALGRLLTDASLLAKFRDSPRATAASLGLEGTDLETFAALDCGQIEAQVELLAERQVGLRPQVTRPGSARIVRSALGAGAELFSRAEEARMRRPGEALAHRHYRILDTTVCLRFGSAALERDVHPVVAHLEVPTSDAVDAELQLLDAGAGAAVLVEGILPVGVCERREEIAPLVQATVQNLASRRHPCLLQIHAGVIGDGEGALLLPGAAGSGKSTLTAGASAAGFRYLSDEMAHLDEDTLEVRCFPMSLTLKEGSMAPLASHYPEAAALPLWLREDLIEVRYLPPPPRALDFDQERSYPVKAVVFPRYAPDVRTALQPISQGEALRRLLVEAVALPTLLDRPKVQSLARWVRRTPFYELPMSSLPRALELLGSLRGEHGSSEEA
jgi:hypothetical protein